MSLHPYFRKIARKVYLLVLSGLLFVYPLGLSDGASRAYEATEMATDTFGAYGARLACLGIKCDGLMAAVQTRHIATPTSDALLAVYLRINDGVAVEVGW